MQSRYPLEIVREMGCTEAELRAWLPGASGGRHIAWKSDGADIALDSGSAAIEWQTLSPRRIALLTMPRLHVRFAAKCVDDAAWQRFMRYFDLYTQRGGG
jgi:hypothetical protein